MVVNEDMFAMDKFEKAIEKIKTLEKYDQYEAALIFGSIVHGDYSDESDLDIVIVSSTDRKFKNRTYLESIED